MKHFYLDTITRNMVKSGYEKGLIKLMKSPQSDGIVCSIGDNWFYFGGKTAANCNDVEQYKSLKQESAIINDIFEQLEEFRNEDDTFGDEYLYYKYYLEEHGITANTAGN